MHIAAVYMYLYTVDLAKTSGVRVEYIRTVCKQKITSTLRLGPEYQLHAGSYCHKQTHIHCMAKNHKLVEYEYEHAECLSAQMTQK